jgi:hypothetical protein
MSNVAVFSDNDGTVNRVVYDLSILSGGSLSNAIILDESELPDLQANKPELGYQNEFFVDETGKVVTQVVEAWLADAEIQTLAENGELQKFVDSGRFSEDSLDEMGVSDSVTF